jgi:hypothetical protein
MVLMEQVVQMVLVELQQDKQVVQQVELLVEPDQMVVVAVVDFLVVVVEVVMVLFGPQAVKQQAQAEALAQAAEALERVHKEEMVEQALTLVVLLGLEEAAEVQEEMVEVLVIK